MAAPSNANAEAGFGARAPAATAPPIERIAVHVVRVPRTSHNRVTHAYGTTPDAHYALVEIEAGGAVGVGEAPTEIWWTGEDAPSVRAAIEHHLAPALLGTPAAVGDALVRMDRALFGNPYAKAAVQMALWDLLGRRTALPLHELLGAAVPHATPIKYDIGWGTVDNAREGVVGGRERGLHYFKLKVGRDLRSDLERTAAAIGELEPGESLGVDVNGGWSLAQAVRAVPELERLGVAFLEQPVRRDQPEALAEVARRTSVPVMVHEALVTSQDALRLAALGAAHLWALTPSIHGGILQTLDILAIARAHAIPCLLGSTFELGIASAHMLHLGAAFAEIRECPVPSDILGPLYVERDIITEPLVLRDGRVQVPSGPGLGVEPDWEYIAACAA
jgi:L-alanine-DL-glutamate epimerase-like enolase superfamily enzyme